MTSMTSMTGKTILHYRVLSTLGKGGMANMMRGMKGRLPPGMGF